MTQSPFCWKPFDSLFVLLRVIYIPCHADSLCDRSISPSLTMLQTHSPPRSSFHLLNLAFCTSWTIFLECSFPSFLSLHVIFSHSDEKLLRFSTATLFKQRLPSALPTLYLVALFCVTPLATYLMAHLPSPGQCKLNWGKDFYTFDLPLKLLYLEHILTSKNE